MIKSIGGCNRYWWKQVVFVLAMMFGPEGAAQLNFLVGYDLGFYPDHAANELFELHNEANSYYKSELDPIRIQHGLQLGLRYGTELAKFGVLYRNSGFRSKAEGIPPGTTESFERQVKFRSNSFGLSIETNYSHVNYGAAISYHLNHITGKTSVLNDSYSVQKNNYWSLQLYLNLEFHGDQNIGFNIQPYYSLPLTDFSLNKLAGELDVNQGNRWKSSMFGVSLLLVNGPRE